MTRNKKILLVGGAGLAVFLWNQAQEVKATINGLKLSFLPAGFPSLKTLGKVIFPLSVRVDNPSNIAIPLDALRVAIHRVNSNGTSYLVAQTPPEGVVLSTFAARKSTVFKMELEMGLLDAVGELYTMYQKRGFNRFRIESVVRAGVVSVPLTTHMTL